MTVARMWESRLDPARVADFVAAVRREVLPALAEVDGFAGGELYTSDDGPRAVLLTRWRDGAAAAGAAEVEAGLAAYCAREPVAWSFEQVLP